MPAPRSARRSFPRVNAAERVRLRSADAGYSPAATVAASVLGEDFDRFRSRVSPTLGDLKENVFEKSAADPFRHDAQYMGSHISITRPDEKLQICVKDRRNRPLPSALRPAALDVLEKPLRCMDKGWRAASGHPSDQFFDAAAARAPPQPIPATTQKHETELIESLEIMLRDEQTQHALWDQYAKRAEELLITMPLDKVIRVLRAFVLAEYRGLGIYTRIGAELAREVASAPTVRLCQCFHWLSCAGLRDPTLMVLMGNEVLLRLSEDFALDMYIEVLNAHAKLELRAPRLLSTMLRDLTHRFVEFTPEQCCAVTPLCAMNTFSEPARVAYLSRCAELNIGLPAHKTKPSVFRQFRLLEDLLRLDYRQADWPNTVQHWLASLRAEADVQDGEGPVALSDVEKDLLRILREEMDVAVTPVVMDGALTLHLVMGKTAIEVLDDFGDYYVTPAMGGKQRLLRADTKLRQRLLWRRGWRLLTLDEGDWTKLTVDLYKRDTLEDLLVTGPRRATPLSR